LARLKSEALPVRPLDCVRAVLATAEKITKLTDKDEADEKIAFAQFQSSPFS
jgi:hypothetical protein